MQSYQKVIFFAHANNLPNFNNNGEEADHVLEQLATFVIAVRQLPRNPTAIVCTIFTEVAWEPKQHTRSPSFEELSCTS